jgi:uncharacterized membrane protein affecting hemolysin expression
MSMIRKSMPSGNDPMGGNRFSDKIMLKNERNVMRASITSLCCVLLMAGATSVLAASSEADFKAAYAAAEAANKEAASLRNQWTVTAAALADAKKAADKGDFDAAVAASKEAEAMAKASIYQATSEKTLWKDLEIR